MQTRLTKRLLITLLAVGTAARAADLSSTRPTNPAVATLIAQLDADDGSARDAAAAKLVERGEAVRPAMVDAAEHAASPEVRSRAAGVIATLNRIAADRPTQITLHVSDADPSSVFDEIARQAGLTITYRSDADGRPPKVTIDAEQQPFWTVMASACRQAHVNPLDLGDDGVTLASDADSRLSAPSSAVDPRLMFVAVKATRAREVSYGPAQPSERDDQFHGALFVDPKLRLLASHLPTLTVAVDDHGATLLPAADRSDPASTTFYANGNIDTFVSAIVLPADASRRLRRMAGHVGLIVGTRTEHVEVADVAAPAAVRSVGPLTLRLTACRIGAHDGSLNLTVTYPGPAWQTPVYAGCRRIRLIDAAGQVLRSREDRKEKDRRTDLTMTYTGAAAVREPVRLVWDAATEWRELQAPFAFEDLPLP